MQSPNQNALTQLLGKARGGDKAAEGEILDLAYAELRQLARAVFSRERKDHTLQPTALVHEAWLRLSSNLEDLDSRRQFFVIAGRVMRQVLVDHARRHAAEKRGGGRRRVTFDTDLPGGSGESSDGIDLVALDDTLRQLRELNPRHADIVELRLFSGMTIPETAEVLGVSPRTIDTEWAAIKAWLRIELADPA